MVENILPREVPDKDSRYMGMAWMGAAFSKDPSTQVGAFLVDSEYKPLGWGYNGPPKGDPDDCWERPDPDCPTKLCKYDLVVHAEINAIKHSKSVDFTNATLYVCAHPCKDCMLDIADRGIRRVVYTNFLSHAGSSLRTVSRDKSEQIAQRYGVLVEEFSGELTWMKSWIARMDELGLFDMYKKSN